MQRDFNKLLKLPDVVRMTGFSKAAIYRDMKSRSFPRPLKLSARRVAWYQDDIQAWLDGLSVATYEDVVAATSGVADG